MSQEHIILAFPAVENLEAKSTDEHLNLSYKKVFGVDYPWLSEHFEFGLPSASKTELFLRIWAGKRSFSGKATSHGYQPYYQR